MYFEEYTFIFEALSFYAQHKTDLGYMLRSVSHGYIDADASHAHINETSEDLQIENEDIFMGKEYDLDSEDEESEQSAIFNGAEYTLESD